MRDLGQELVQAALEKGLISAKDVERVEGLVKSSGGRDYAAQVLVRERMISCNDLLTLQNNLRAKLYECPGCHKRFSRKALPDKRRKAFKCKGCEKRVYLEEASLSRLEVLTSRDPLDLTITLREAGEVTTSSEVSAIDLDRYELGEELGRGGYGVVFKAFHKDLQRDVALKVLRPHANLPRVTLERFIREGRSASRLTHPNVVSVYDIGRSKDLYALAMEFVPGRALKALIKERERIPWPEAVELMDQILAGVQHAHEKGIIHRDLKPTNIIIEAETNRPRIIDFGLAKDLDADVALTMAGAIVGTPFYLSPEQIEGRSAKVDARSDVFALGVILYFMVCGERPFQSKLKSEVYALILNEEPTPPSKLAPDLPPALEAVILKAMQKKRSERFQSVAEMREALTQVSEASESTDSESSSPRRKRTSQQRRVVPSKTDSRRASRSRTTRPVAAVSGGLPLGAKLALAGAGFIVVLGLMAIMSGGSGSADGGGGVAAVDPPRPPAPPVRSGDAPNPPAEDPPVEQPPAEDPPLEAGLPSAQDPSAQDPSAQDPPAQDPPAQDPPAEDPLARDPPARNEPGELAVGPGGALGPGDAGAVEPKPRDETPAEPKPVVLDRGERDAAEFPILAERSEKKWIERAFLINALSDVSPPRPYGVRALRFALNDRFPLNRAFALRGLARVQDGGFLRAYGSQALFDALRDLLDEREEPYVRRTSQELLLRMAGGGQARSPKAWETWWTEVGEAMFEEAARRPPDLRAPSQDVRDAEQLSSQTRQGFQVFSKLRSQGLDLYFVLDVTKSMDDELARMHAQVTEITSFMQLLLKGKVQLGFVTFGDKVVKQTPLTKKLGVFARDVEAIKIFDDPSDRSVEEGISLGLEAALSKSVGWRKRARRTILLLGDAPPLDPKRCADLADLAGKQNVIINGLIAPPPAKYAARWPPKPAFEEIARRSGGLTAELDEPEELITRILMLSLGGDQEADLRRFVHAYRDVTGTANQARQ